MADEAVCLWQPEPFGAIGLYYEHFVQISDDEVRELLESTTRVVEPW
jgi:predicted phosphoribosyltransferase